MKEDNKTTVSAVPDEIDHTQSVSSIGETLKNAYDATTINKSEHPKYEAEDLPLDDTGEKESSVDTGDKECSEADQIDLLEKLKSVFEPFKQDLEEAGLDEVRACELLLNVHHSLQAEPAETLYALADHYGVEFGGEKPKDEALPKFISAQIKHMSVEKTNDGQLKFPHIEELKSEIETILSSGRARDVVSAYESATWSHPNYREKKIADLRSQIESEKEAEFISKQKEKEKAASLNLVQRGKRLASGDKGQSAKETMALIFDQINN